MKIQTNFLFGSRKHILRLGSTRLCASPCEWMPFRNVSISVGRISESNPNGFYQLMGLCDIFFFFWYFQMCFGIRRIIIYENILKWFAGQAQFGSDWHYLIRLFLLSTHISNAYFRVAPQVFYKQGFINSLSMCAERIFIYHSQMKYYSVLNVIFYVLFTAAITV